MKTKIRYYELNELSKYVIDRSDEIDSILENINRIIYSLEGKWQGKDCQNLVKKANEIIVEERVKNKKIKQFGNDLSVVSSDYLNIDNKWLGQIRKAGKLNDE